MSTTRFTWVAVELAAVNGSGRDKQQRAQPEKRCLISYFMSSRPLPSRRETMQEDRNCQRRIHEQLAHLAARGQCIMPPAHFSGVLGRVQWYGGNMPRMGAQRLLGSDTVLIQKRDWYTGDATAPLAARCREWRLQHTRGNMEAGITIKRKEWLASCHSCCKLHIFQQQDPAGCDWPTKATRSLQPRIWTRPGLTGRAGRLLVQPNQLRQALHCLQICLAGIPLHVVPAGKVKWTRVFATQHKTNATELAPLQLSMISMMFEKGMAVTSS